MPLLENSTLPKLMYLRNDPSNTAVQNFVFEAQCDIDSISEAFPQLFDILVVLNTFDKFYPVQCNETIRLVELMKKSVEDLCLLLSNSRLIPFDVISIRYKFLVRLHYLNESMIKFLPLIATFRSICCDESIQTKKIWRQISKDLKAILDDVKGVEEMGIQLIQAADPGFTSH